MKALKSLVWPFMAMSFLFNQTALAVPVFQVYIDDAFAGTVGADEDTWFTTSSSFDLIVAGAYGPNTKQLTDITLLVSVVESQTGTISITGGDGVTLLAEKTAAADGFYNPNSEADVDLLTNEAGNPDGYDGYTDKSFLPGDIEFNNHYPFQEGVSDFLIYSLGDFDKVSNAVSNYSTDEPISYNVANGQEKTYAVSISGFTSVHFDVYGFVQTDSVKGLETAWRINPGSHDASYMVPEPATVLILGLGSVILLKRKRPSKTLSRN